MENLIENNTHQAQDTVVDTAVEAPAPSGLEKLQTQLSSAEEMLRNAERIHKSAAKEVERLRMKIAIEEAVQAALAKERERAAQHLARQLEKQKQKYIKQIERMELALKEAKAPKPERASVQSPEAGNRRGVVLPDNILLLMKEMVGKKKSGTIPPEDRAKAFLEAVDKLLGVPCNKFSVRFGKSVWTFETPPDGDGLQFSVH